MMLRYTENIKKKKNQQIVSVNVIFFKAVA